MPICICIVSKYPMIKTFTSILQKLNAKASHFLNYPLESYIKYLVNSIPAPPRGFHKLAFHIFDSDIIEIIPPAPNALPLCDINFYPLAKSLNPENIVRALNYILLERPIIFISTNIETLGPALECILALIYPFKYQMIYIPVLPLKLIDVLQVSCPFIIGIQRQLFDKYHKTLNLSSCIVDLDKDEVFYYERRFIEANFSKFKPNVELAPLPDHEKKKLLARVVPLFTKIKQIGEGEQAKAKSEELESCVWNIREAFLLFLVSTLKTYGDYWEKKDGEYQVNREKLVANSDEDYKWFLLQFTRTKMFMYWEYAKQRPTSYTEAYDLLFFDESITSKQNRIASLMSTKKPTPFLDEKKAFAIQFMEIIKMPKPSETILNRKVVLEAYLKNNTILPLMLTHGVGETSGYYYRFIPEFCPELLEISNTSLVPANKIADCENKLKELKFIPEIELYKPAIIPSISQSPKLTKEDKTIELWIRLWCKTFACHEIQEHQYRLDQLLEILALYQRKDLLHLLEIYTEIMKVCYRFGSARLALRFYDNINSPILKSHPNLFSLYLAAISAEESGYPLRENYRMPKSHSEKFEEAKLKPEDSGTFLDYPTYFKSCLQPYHLRTFLTHTTGHVVSEEIKLGFFTGKCKACGFEGPQKSFEKGNENFDEVRCAQCDGILNCRIRARIGRPVIYAKEGSVYWQEEFELYNLDSLLEAVNKMGAIVHGENILDFKTLRLSEVIFWNLIWHFSLFKLPYDWFLPYKEDSRKSLLIQRKLVREKTAARLNITPEKENLWLDQFKQIRAFALCTDSETQTDTAPSSPSP